MAGAVTNYSVGNNVYKGGSTSANGGIVDPTGYIDRSITGNLAQAALNRLRSQAPATNSLLPNPLNPLTNSDIFLQGGNPPHIQGPPIVNPAGAPPTSTPPPAQPTQQPLQQTTTAPQQNSDLPLQGSPAQISQENQANGKATIPQPKVQPLNVDALGQLSLPKNLSLPLDSDLAAQEASQVSNYNNILDQLTGQQNNISQQYALAARQALNELPDQLNSLLARYGSGQGMGFSTGYGQQYGQTQDNMQQTLDNLFSTAQNGLSNIGSQAALVPNQLQLAIQNLLSTQAERNTQSSLAGQLLGMNQNLANQIDPNTSTYYAVVNNPVDRDMALKAGWTPVVDSSYTGPSLGIGTLPTNAGNVVYAGKAGVGKTGVRTAVGSDRNVTEQELAQIKNPSAAQTMSSSSAARVAPTNGSAAPSATYNVKQADGKPVNSGLVNELKSAGFSGNALNTMYGIVMAESGGNPQAHNYNPNTGDDSYGLDQFNIYNMPGRLKEYGLTNSNQLLDPMTNLKIGYTLSNKGTNFNPWSTYKSGAYKKFLPVGSL